MTEQIYQKPLEAGVFHLLDAIFGRGFVIFYCRLSIDSFFHDFYALIDDAIQLQEGCSGQQRHNISWLDSELILVQGTKDNPEGYEKRDEYTFKIVFLLIIITIKVYIGIKNFNMDHILFWFFPSSRKHAGKIGALHEVNFVQPPFLPQSHKSYIVVLPFLKECSVNVLQWE